MGMLRKLCTIVVGITLLIGGLHAQAPENIRAELEAMGNTLDPARNIRIYRPLHATPPYKNVQVTRDLSYGPDPRNILDIFVPDTGTAPRPVLMYVAGGIGDKIQTDPNAEVFYDNVMLWAAGQQMTGVNVGRRGAFGGNQNGEDIALAIRWVHENIAKYGGDTRRIFIWGHSNGAVSISEYLARKQLQGPDGVGVTGAIMMAGPYNLAPVEVQGALSAPRRPAAAPSAAPATSGAPTAAPRSPRPPADPAERLRTSVLPGMRTVDLPLLLAAGEWEPTPWLNSTLVLDEEMRKAGKKPTLLILKGHNHMSEVYSVNTADTSVSGPILEWMKSVK